MLRKTNYILLIIVGMLLIISNSSFAAKAKKVTPGNYKGIAKLMRENGFKAKTASWTSNIAQTTEGSKTETSETKAWISGNKYRMESKDKQKQQIQVILDDGNNFYMYNPAEKKAFKMGDVKNTMFASILNSDVVAESARQRKQAKKVGTETIDGKACDILEYRSTLNVLNSTVNSDVKEWLWVKEQFPLKSIVKTPKHQMKIAFMSTDVPASETITDVKNLVINVPMDETLFSLPEGTKIETMEMPNNAMSGKAAGEQSQGGNSQPDTTGNAQEEEQSGPPPVVKDILKGLF
jgi:outer membrane lipoprotein-sorting protein